MFLRKDILKYSGVKGGMMSTVGSGKKYTRFDRYTKHTHIYMHTYTYKEKNVANVHW